MFSNVLKELRSFLEISSFLKGDGRTQGGAISRSLAQTSRLLWGLLLVTGFIEP